MKMQILGVSALTMLAACGGSGGGGGSDVTSFQSFQEVPENGTIRVNGQAVSAAFTYDPETDTVELSGAPTSTRNALLDVTLNDEIIEQVKLSQTNNNVSFNTNDGDTVEEDFGVLFLEGGNGDTYAVFLACGDFNYQTFGAWGNEDDTSGSVSVGSFGARTEAQSMPQNGSAAYEGESIGVVAGEEIYSATASDVSVEADFDSSNVVMTSTGTVLVDIESNISSSAAPELDFVGSGDIEGSTFNAEIGSPLMSGTADGQFYGPNAEEVGGTFVSGNDSVSYTGSFDARQVD